jgi:protein gp37
MQKTTIEWCDYTWNPVTGCKHNCTKKTAGFDCYAMKLHNMRHKAYLEGKKMPEQYAFPFDDPHVWNNRLLERMPKTPSIIFVGSMCDLFGKWVSSEVLEYLLMQINDHPEHIFMFLTKNPVRYADFEYPENVMLGHTITGNSNLFDLPESPVSFPVKSFFDMKYVRNHRIFLSYEPMLYSTEIKILNYADLVIVGADTSKNPTYPQPDDVQRMFNRFSPLKHDRVFFKENIRKYYPDLPAGNKQQIWDLFK